MSLVARTRLPGGSGRVSSRTVLLVASFGAFLAFLDATIVNVAFPSIVASFPGSSISGLSWILNAYNIVFASALVISGRLADLIGRRRAFTSGVLLFTAASALCALAPSVGFLVGARLVQAVGAAVLVPASLALVVDAFPAARRSHAVGLWGASAALASGLGPPIGGALVEAGGWRWAFLVNIPFGVAALVAGRRLLVESRAPGRRRLPDLLGAVLSAGMLGLLTLGIVKGNDWGWDSWQVLCSFAGSLLLFAGFVVSSRRHRSPLLDPALLRIRSFSVGNAASVLAGMGFYAYLLTNVLWLQYVWGYSVLRAGLALVPGAVVAAVLAAVLGPVAQRRGYRLVIIPGALVWALAYVWYATRVGTQPDFLGEWLPGQLLSGLGVGATLPILGSAALAAVPGGRFATASAVNSSARQIGAVLGISVLVLIIGAPSPTSTVASFRHGWVFSSVCFVLVALVAFFIGRVRSSPEAEDAADLDQPPSVWLPADWLPTDGMPTDGMPTDGMRSEQALSEGASATGVSSSQLGSDTFFARLPVATRERLERGARPRALSAGELLFSQGDAAEDAFVVRSGRLEVVVAGEPVRSLGAGAVVGELALITGSVRSATVRARRDTSLLQVSRRLFDESVRRDVDAMTALTSVLAEQLQSPRPAPATRALAPRVVAVVAVGDGAPVAGVAAALVVHLRRSLTVAEPGVVDAEGLERAERDCDRVVLVADGSDPVWWDRAVRQADQLVLVARSDLAVPTLAPVASTGADLVLVGPPAAAGVVRGWAALLDTWQVVQASGPLPAELRPLAARIAGRSVGLVLAGGGARAFAHIGVLQELAAAGVAVDRVAGSSQGSIIAALHATGFDPSTIQELCYEEFVRRRPFSDYTLPLTSLAKGKRTERALRGQLGDISIEELPRIFRCASTDLQARAVHAHRSGPLVDAVMASIALPVLFPPRQQSGTLLADGGVLDNLPVSLLNERAEGPLVAVNIGMGGDRAPRTSSSTDGGGSERRARVPGLGETLLRTMFIGSGGAVAAAHAAGAVVVTPAAMGVGLLEFHQLDRMVESGRQAGRALLEQAGSFLGV